MMAHLTVVPADDTSARKAAWEPIADAMAAALAIPGLPADDRADLVLAYRAAAEITGRPLIAPPKAPMELARRALNTAAIAEQDDRWRQCLRRFADALPDRSEA